MKRIVSVYKSYLRSASGGGGDTKITDPFLCMNIVCPQGSYDVNVEPAKDEVLFSNPDFVVFLAEKCFKIVYGELQESLPKAAASRITAKPSGIDIMLARKEPSTLQEPLVSQSTSENPWGHPRPSCVPQLQQASNSLQTRALFPPAIAPNAQKEYEVPGPSKDSTASDDVNNENNDLVHNTSILIDSISGLSPDASGGITDNTAPCNKGSFWKPSMYADGDDEDEHDQLEGSSSSAVGPAVQDEAEEGNHLKSVHVSNPWVFAKLNAPFRPPARAGQQQTPNPESNDQLPTPARQPGDAGNAMEPLSAASRPDAAANRRSQHHAGNGPTHSSPSPFPFPLKARGRRKADEVMETPVPSGSEHYGRGFWDRLRQKSLGSNLESADAFDNEETVGGDRGPADIDIAYSGPFVSARLLPMGTPLTEIPDVSERPRRKAAPQKQQQGNISKPYVSPVNDPERVWFETGETRKRKPQEQPRLKQKQRKADVLMLREDEDGVSIMSESTPLSAPSMHPDLALTMDYEARKQLATQQHRESLRQQARQTATENGTTSSVPTTSPHKNRQNAAIADLHTDDHHAFPLNSPVFEANDPRAYLIRSKQTEGTEMHKSPASWKSKRRKTSMLPFETLREDKYMGDLVQIIKTADLDLDSMLHESWNHDDYNSGGIISSAFLPSAMTKERVRDWERRLKAMTKMQYRLEGMEVDEEMDGELELDLWGILKEHCG